MHKESDELLHFAMKEETKFSCETHTLRVGNEVLIDYDSGKRQRISNANERSFLAPYQP